MIKLYFVLRIYAYTFLNVNYKKSIIEDGSWGVGRFSIKCNFVICVNFRKINKVEFYFNISNIRLYLGVGWDGVVWYEM